MSHIQVINRLFNMRPQSIQKGYFYEKAGGLV